MKHENQTQMLINIPKRMPPYANQKSCSFPESKCQGGQGHLKQMKEKKKSKCMLNITKKYGTSDTALLIVRPKTNIYTMSQGSSQL
jgi:hypothetical protein